MDEKEKATRDIEIRVAVLKPVNLLLGAEI